MVFLAIWDNKKENCFLNDTPININIPIIKNGIATIVLAFVYPYLKYKGYCNIIINIVINNTIKKLMIKDMINSSDLSIREIATNKTEASKALKMVVD